MAGGLDQTPKRRSDSTTGQRASGAIPGRRSADSQSVQLDLRVVATEGSERQFDAARKAKGLRAFAQSRLSAGLCIGLLLKESIHSNNNDQYPQRCHKVI